LAEPGIRLKELLERLIEDPGKIRGYSRAYRPGDWWLTEVEMPSQSFWWVIWRMDESRVRVRWISPSPQEFI
jgi:hypothetical protein